MLDSLINSIPTWLLRLALVGVSMVGWFWTQKLVGSRPARPAGRIDFFHRLTQPIHGWLLSHRSVTRKLLILSSVVIDVFVIFILVQSLFGPSFKPFLEVLCVFALRQLALFLIDMPLPDGMIWFHPGVPSLVVTYGVANDLFFSGHTSLAIIGALEVSRLGILPLTIAAWILAAGEAFWVLLLRAHWFIDVAAAVVIAFGVYGAFNGFFF